MKRAIWNGTEFVIENLPKPKMKDIRDAVIYCHFCRQSERMIASDFGITPAVISTDRKRKKSPGTTACASWLFWKR